jgi:hypothetical protein
VWLSHDARSAAKATPRIHDRPVFIAARDDLWRHPSEAPAAERLYPRVVSRRVARLERPSAASTGRRMGPLAHPASSTSSKDRLVRKLLYTCM